MTQRPFQVKYLFLSIHFSHENTVRKEYILYTYTLTMKQRWNKWVSSLNNVSGIPLIILEVFGVLFFVIIPHIANFSGILTTLYWLKLHMVQNV